MSGRLQISDDISYCNPIAEWIWQNSFVHYETKGEALKNVGVHRFEISDSRLRWAELIVDDKICMDIKMDLQTGHVQTTMTGIKTCQQVSFLS